MKSFALQLPLVLFVLTAPTAFGASPGKPAQEKPQSSCSAGATCGDSRDVWSIGAAGPEKAPITVLIFADFESFLCGRAAHVLVDVFGESTKARLIFKHAPSTKSDNAMLAHEAAIAAGAQGKFWEMHNLLFDNQTKLTRTDLSNYARQLGLNLAVFDAALNSHTYRSMIDHDLADAKGLGVTTTPTFFINGRRLVGPQAPSAFSAVLDSVVAGLPSRANDQVAASGPALAIDLTHAPAKGSVMAPVSIVEFSDFECPYCAESVAVLREVMKAYPTQVRLSFKHSPLNSHPKSPLAHEAALAAGDQGKFWEMHDLIFATQDRLKREDLIHKAQELKLDVAQFVSALDDHRFKATVEADRQEGQRLGVDGTPFFFINGHPLSDSASLSDFKRLIDASLKETTTPTPK